MAKHTITLELPKAPVINSDAVFTIRGDGRIVGTLTVSRGNLEWYSARWQSPTRMPWGRFDRLMYENRTPRRKRK